MPILSITARGQLTLKKEILQHMGIAPGGKVEVDKLPDGRVVLKAERPKRPMSEFIGSLAGKSSKVATLEEIDEAIQAGWAGQIED
jgi:antitoxin PrlF